MTKLYFTWQLKTVLKQRKNFFFLFSLFFSFFSYSQTSGTISLNWTGEVGCQNIIPSDTRKINLENISDDFCLKVCENSVETYTLVGVPANSVVQWNVNGGFISNAYNNTICEVGWDVHGVGSISFQIITPSVIISKSICIEKIIIPKADFNIFPFSNLTHNTILIACSNQALIFTNQSNPANGSPLLHYLWDFGDGTPFSSALNPTHTYSQNGTYFATLTVTNSCSCSTSVVKRIKIGNEGFNISCPGPVCENQTVTYSLPFDGSQICQGNYNWNVTGGTSTINQTNGDVTVNWNTVDESGFGYVTFFPANCSVACLDPTTIKIPVIKTVGTIVGSAKICVGNQATYSLPKWPTTDFHWEILNNTNDAGLLFLNDQRNEVVIEARIAGTYILRCTYQNTLLHCGGTAEIRIKFINGFDFTGTEFVCLNSTATYTLTSAGVTNWTLHLPNNTTQLFSNAHSVTPLFTMVGDYSLSVEGNGTCLGLEHPISVLSLPQSPMIQMPYTTEVCPNAPYIYRILNPSSVAQYQWAVTGGTLLGSSVGNQITVQFTDTGTHVLSVYTQNVTPILCSSPPTVIPITLKQINAEIAGSITSCANTSGQIYNLVVPGTTTAYNDGETYTWSFVNSNGTTNTTIGSISAGQGTRTATINWNNITTAGTQVYVKVVITKCTLTPKVVTFLVVLNPSPIIEILPVASACSGSTIAFTIKNPTSNGITLPSTSQVVWNFNGTPITITGLTSSYVYNVFAPNVTKSVTAYIITPSGCFATTNTASTQFSILPGPPATASLQSQYNSFCDVSSVNVTMAVSSVIDPNVSYQWFCNNVAISGATQSTLTLSPSSPTNFGQYYFVATNNVTLCSTQSNSIVIFQRNCNLSNCNLSFTPVFQNNSTKDADCKTISLTGAASNNPNETIWSIYGPFTNLVNYQNSQFVAAQAGIYHVNYTVGYDNNNGQTCYFSEQNLFTIPYIPDFSYEKSCSNNNTFTLDLLDKTNFYAAVTNPSVQFSYKPLPTNSSIPWTVITGTTISGLPPGNYAIRIVVNGALNNIAQPTCEKIVNFNLSGVQALTITKSPIVIDCLQTPVRFGINNGLTDTILWTLEEGTAEEVTNTSPVFTRVFTTSGTKQVRVRVTNMNGCSLEQTTTVVIPPNCFTGVVSASPSLSVCDGIGATVTLSYTAGVGNCTPTDYIWMDGTAPVAGAPNAPSLAVTTTGFYWLKVKKGFCYLDSPVFTPVFKSPPSVKLELPASVCFSEPIVVKAITVATNVRWFIDTAPISSYNDLTTITLNGLSVGIHEIRVVATANGCSAESVQNIDVLAAPTEPVVSASIESCDPFVVKLLATSNVAGIFNWSNGATGNLIYVNHGGVYQVKVTSGSCTAKAQINVPKNPEDYMWVFPTGCVAVCTAEPMNNSIIGPILPVNSWQWNLDGTNVGSGSGVTSPLILTAGGTYTFNLSTGVPNNDCAITSEPLSYTPVFCEKCPIYLKEIGSAISLNQGFCSFEVTIDIENANSTTIVSNLTSANNLFTFLPSSLSILPGTHTYVFVIIPLASTFTGGTTAAITINGLLGGQSCTELIEIPLPSCTEVPAHEGRVAVGFNTGSVLRIHPNPASTVTTITYESSCDRPELSVYDVYGRLVVTTVTNTSKGYLELDTSSYGSGVYIVVLRENGIITYQDKLIKH